MTPGAVRARRCRQRKARGQAVLLVPVTDYHALLNVLIDAKWLGEAESEDRRQVEKAVGAVLSDLAEWQKNRNA